MRSPTTQDRLEPREIVFLIYPQAMSLDVCGPLEAFDIAGRLLMESKAASEAVYKNLLLAEKAGPVALSSGIRLVAETDIETYSGRPDTLIVAGGFGATTMCGNENLLAFLARTASRARRVASVCTGTFLMAAAGLLDGLRATTHWRQSARLASEYPAIKVEPDSIFIKQGHVYTSAGVTAGIDLALALIEEDFGAGLSLEVARTLVLPFRRPGGQAQFSSSLAAQARAAEPFGDLCRWLIENLTENITVERMADQVHMSPRNFARIFANHTGVTPARFLELVRLDRARLLLQSTALGLDAVALECGFKSTERLRRGFMRQMGTTPRAYRSGFRHDSGNLGTTHQKELK